MTVSDSGIGMDAAAISRLFQPFSQADSSMSRRYGGSGLGLAISKRLAELMGGTLDVVSTPGAGSCFTCRVPVRVIIEAPPAPAPAKPATRPLRWSGAVLVIEDNAVNQEVARAMLSRLGLTVTVANDGQSALERVNGASFDLIFMDCQMPVMDGLEATRRLRAQDYRKPIVAMTANALPSDRQACLAAGMDDYLAKPITIDRLKKTLVQFLGSPNSG
jgi:CheY-like chemotaxis protein